MAQVMSLCHRLPGGDVSPPRPSSESGRPSWVVSPCLPEPWLQNTKRRGRATAEALGVRRFPAPGSSEFAFTAPSVRRAPRCVPCAWRSSIRRSVRSFWAGLRTHVWVRSVLGAVLGGLDPCDHICALRCWICAILVMVWVGIPLLGSEEILLTT